MEETQTHIEVGQYRFIKQHEFEGLYEVILIYQGGELCRVARRDGRDRRVKSSITVLPTALLVKDPPALIGG